MTREQQLAELARLRGECEKMFTMYRDAGALADAKMQMGCLAAIEKFCRQAAETLDWDLAKHLVHEVMAGVVALRFGHMPGFKLAELERIRTRQRQAEILRVYRRPDEVLPPPPEETAQPVTTL